MSGRLRLGLAFLTCGILIYAGGLSAAGKKNSPKSDPGLATAEKVLRAEVAGQVDRRDQLAGALRELTDSPAVRWQAGFVRDGNSWHSFDESSTAAKDVALLAEYQSQRREAANDFAGQLSLADWCKQHKLVDQERAHLTAALAVAPADKLDPVRIRLGWQQVGGVWLSREDLLEWQKLNRLTEASLKKWEAKLVQSAKGLAGPARQRDIAAKALAKIEDPSAVPAIELTLAGQSEDLAQAAIKALSRISGPDSSVALARQGVFSNWPEVRQAAAGALKSRALEDFVPPLLTLLATPTKSEMRVTAPMLRRNGDRRQFVFMVSLVLSRETENQFQVAAFHTTNFQINEALNGIQVRSRGGDIDPSRIPGVVRGANDAYRATAEQAAAQQRMTEQMNEQTAELNGRVATILATVSGTPATSEPHVWWDWWQAHNETQSLGEKPTYLVSEEYLVGNPQSGYQQRCECLVAGTPVWTDAGLQAIETIVVGDRVLAQDIETGELAYKPVLRATVRPPKELWTVRVGQDSFVLTGGHRFWCSGQGWVKARDLEPQSLLHTVTGNTPVWSAKKGEAAQTYNLEVADFHTYFVGTMGILSQDVSTPRGTDSIVPGLSRSNAVASTKK